MAKQNVSNGRSEIDAKDLKDQIARIESDISELTALLAQLGVNEAQEASAKLHATGERIAERAKAATDAAGAQISALEDRARGQVQQNPGMAMGLAAAAGFAVGMAMSRARS